MEALGCFISFWGVGVLRLCEHVSSAYLTLNKFKRLANKAGYCIKIHIYFKKRLPLYFKYPLRCCVQSKNRLKN